MPGSRNIARPLLALAIFLTSCSTSRYHSDYPLSSYSVLSREGKLSYRVPRGWFDAQFDSQRTTNDIWLIRSDYAATIAVSEIQLEESIRTNVVYGGLENVAFLTMKLSSGSQHYIVVRNPETFKLNSKEFCTYELASHNSAEVLRVAIFTTGRRFFEVSAFVREPIGKDVVGEVFSAQQSFLKELKW